ncbi:MAG TPA: type 1 glutamine amidotransferase [Acidimicrobiales bacterium]
MTTCVVIQHVEPEGPFEIAAALLRAGVTVDVRRVFAGDPVPGGADGLDGLVVMGGPMSAASDEGFASRPAELALLGDALEQGVPTLGVCLGAQLLAAAAGASVYPGARGPEVGWGAVDALDTCAGDRLFDAIESPVTVLQWHGDTFDLPVAAERLLRNDVYENQAFRIGEAAWGVQFHLEVDAPAVEGFLASFGADLQHMEGGAEGIRSATPAAVSALAATRSLVLDRFAVLVATNVVDGDLVEAG